MSEEPVTPWVDAAQRRHRIPFWAVPVLALLPLWAVAYALTLDRPTPTEPRPLELGAQVYDQSCAFCHGSAGEGVGSTPALVGEHATPSVFPTPAEQVGWVALGSNGYRAAGRDTYGSGAPRPVGGAGVMPSWAESLTPEQLMAVVLHERSTLNDEAFDPVVWADGFDATLSELLPPDQVAEYVAVLEEWSADPPA